MQFMSFTGQAFASIAQLVEHALRKRTVVGSIPTGGFLFCIEIKFAKQEETAVSPCNDGLAASLLNSCP